MFIDRDLKRVNIFAPYTAEDGTGYANLVDPRVREKVQVVEISEPSAPEDYTPDLYFRTESNHPPYVEYERKPIEMIEAAATAKLKAWAIEYLNNTDWHIVRMAETGAAVPDEVLRKRKEAREVLNK